MANTKSKNAEYRTVTKALFVWLTRNNIQYMYVVCDEFIISSKAIYVIAEDMSCSNATYLLEY